MIYKLQLTLIFLFLSLIGFSQDFSDTITDQHILIKGTNIYMVPPNLFEPSQNFKGFKNPNDPFSMMMVVEIPGPFSEISKGFESDSKLKAKGMELTSIKEVTLAGYDGLLIELEQYASGMDFNKHNLVFGDDSSTTMINGVYIKDSLALGKNVKESIFSTFVDTKLKANPRNALSYTLDESIGGLQFHSVIGNGMLFNRDLKTPTESKDKATLITDQSFEKFEIEDKKSFCISRLEKYPDPVSIVSKKDINKIEIDNLKGYELLATNQNDDTEEMYQAILFEENGGYFIFVGTYVKTEKNALRDIKKILQTFKRN